MSKANKTTKPIKMLGLSLTGRCNFKCAYCYAEMHPQETLSYGDACKAIDLAAGSNGSNEFIVQFTGGEPLLEFALLKRIVGYVEEKKYKAILQIQTNGSLVTEKIAKFLARSKIGVGVSLDGRPQINNKTRMLADGTGGTNAALRGISILKKNNVAIGITCVVSENNVEQLPGIVEMAYYLGNVRKIGFDLLRAQGRGEKLKSADVKKLRRSLTLTYTLAEKMEHLTTMKIHFSQIDNVKVVESSRGKYNFGHCYAMNGNAAFVDARGDIYACSSLIGMKEFYLGNVNSGIDQEKNAKVQKRIKDAMLYCRSCADFYSCGGGCFARWLGRIDRRPCEEECALKRLSIAWVKGDK